MVSVEVSVELIDLFICDSSVGKAFAQLVEAEHTCDAVVTSEAPETVTAAANAAVIISAGTAALQQAVTTITTQAAITQPLCSLHSSF